MLEMCRALAARGHEVELATTTIDGPHTLDVAVGSPVDAGGFTIVYHAPSAPRGWSTSPGLARTLRDRIPRADVVHVHSLYRFHTTVASFLARRAHVPYVVRPHGTLDPYHRAAHARAKAVYDRLVERRNLDGATAIHCTSEAERAAVTSLGLRPPAVVVPLGIDPAPFAGDVERDPATIVSLGRLTPKKGLDLLIDAVAQIDHARLVLAGPDDEGLGEKLRLQARRLGVADRVTFAGIVTGGAKVDLLRRATVFALPSEDENLAVAVLEALAAATPVVLTRGVAIHGEVRDAGAGVVVDRRSDALVDALARLLGDAASRRAMGAAGRELVASRFSWDAIVPELEALYARR